MRAVTFSASGSDEALGILDEEWVIEPARVLAGSGLGYPSPYPTNMLGFLMGGHATRGEAARAVDLARIARERGDDQVGVHRRADVALHAPLARPRRIRDYLTYDAHARGAGMSVPPAFAAMPICYKCNVETVIGPEQELLWPSYTDQLDFELELGFFCSRGGRNLSIDEAAADIAGVTIFNDVSARDIQFFEMSMGIGPSKGKDFCSAMGPAVLTADEVDEWSIGMSASVNGELWAQGTTADRKFSFAEVLAWASLDEEVYPGEFFAVGTVGGGCGLEQDRWIAPGDIVELTADGVGSLRNPVGTRQPYIAGLPSYTGSPRHTADNA